MAEPSCAATASVQPSLLPFTPWTTLASLVGLMDFVADHDLIGNVDPVHYSIQLLGAGTRCWSTTRPWDRAPRSLRRRPARLQVELSRPPDRQVTAGCVYAARGQTRPPVTGQPLATSVPPRSTPWCRHAAGMEPGHTPIDADVAAGPRADRGSPGGDGSAAPSRPKDAAAFSARSEVSAERSGSPGRGLSLGRLGVVRVGAAAWSVTSATSSISGVWSPRRAFRVPVRLA